jgi:hypothetical protein
MIQYVDLIGLRPKHKMKLILMIPHGQEKPDTRWEYLARNISKEEANYQLQYIYDKVTQQK